MTSCISLLNHKMWNYKDNVLMHILLVWNNDKNKSNHMIVKVHWLVNNIDIRAILGHVNYYMRFNMQFALITWLMRFLFHNNLD